MATIIEENKMEKSDESSQKKERRAKKLPIAITKQEYESLIEHTKSPKHKLAFYLGFNSGLRVSEVVKLEQRDIDIAGSKIFIRMGKGSKDRIAPMPKGFQKKYQDLLPLGIGVRALQKAFRNSAEASGLLKVKPTAHFHSLRHGFATYFLEQGGNIQLLKVLMGHTNISTTDIYNQLNPKVALDAYKELF
jgi:integrase/recombinase XerD